jgi:hypothetical protein
MSFRQRSDFVPQKLVKDDPNAQPKDQLEDLIQKEVARQLRPILERIEKLESAIEDDAD